MRVPLLDLSAQHRVLREPIRRAIDEVLATQQFILGPNVAQFEQSLAELCGVPHAIGMSSGTDALLAALMSLDIGTGDAVITPSFTFFGTAGSVARLGATPVFIDIDSATYNISTAAVERYVREQCHRNSTGELINDGDQRVRALLPVHLFGVCCDMKPLLALAARERLPVIEDAAQAFGAEYPLDGKAAQAGTMGEIGTFSFYPTKNLGAAGDAGAIVCRDASTAEELRACRQHGMRDRYFHDFIGGNFRLDEIQAAILRVKLPYVNEWSAARRLVADHYRELFDAAGLTNDLALPAEPYRDFGLTNHHIYHQFVVRTSERDRLREHLAKAEIGTAIYYPLGLHQQRCFSYLGYREGDLPETERAARETLALPIYAELTREQQEHVVTAIAKFLR